MMKPRREVQKQREKQRSMTCEFSEARLKRSVKRLKRFLHDKGYPLKHCEIFEAAAILHGFNNWSTMKEIGFSEHSKSPEDQS